MAKKHKKTATATRAPTIRVNMPPQTQQRAIVVAPPQFLQQTQAALQKSGKKFGGKAAAFAHAERHMLVAVASAGALGLAESRGIALPQIDALGTAGTYGVAAYVYAKLTGSQTAEKVATGLLSVAIYKLAAAQTPAGTPPAGTPPAGAPVRGRL